MKKILNNESGNILVLTAAALVVLMGFASLSIDVGSMLTARNQLQSAVDAAALAGASGLMVNQTEAITRAISIAGSNNCIRQPVQISAADVSFPISSQVRVQGTHPVNLFFARVLGLNTANIQAVAVAELGTLVGTGDLKPWAVPDFGWDIGTPVTIKSGVLGAPSTGPSFFYPVDFPPLNRGTPIPGAQVYEENIISGSVNDIFIDDLLQVEPGNMVGPTQQGVNFLINQDPNAYWGSDDDGGGAVMNSAFPGYSSPRIIKIPLYDPEIVPDSGRNYVTVIGLAAFFIMDIQGRDVTGAFMEITTSGTAGSGYSLLKGVKLVQ